MCLGDGSPACGVACGRWILWLAHVEVEGVWRVVVSMRGRTEMRLSGEMQDDSVCIRQVAI